MQPEIYTVQLTTPLYHGEKPYAVIVIDGHIAAVPCRLNLQAGDRLIVERVGIETACATSSTAKN